MSFVDASFNELVFSPILPPHSHVILHAGLARSCRITFQKAKENLLPGGSFTSGRLRVLGKSLFSGLHPLSTAVLPLPEGGGYLLENGFCDFAFGFAQNDRVGGILRRVKVLGIEKPTI